MTTPPLHTTPYGTWPSPLSAETVAAAATRLGGLAVTSQTVFWGERRPQEKGRTAVVAWHPGATGAEAGTVERLPEPWNVRSRAHEYGGGSFVAADVTGRTLFYSDFGNDRIWAQSVDSDGVLVDPIALTPENDAHGPTPTYADLRVHPGGEWLIAACETHLPTAADGSHAEPTASLVAISLAPLRGDAPEVRELTTAEACQADFLSSPALTADGNRVAWLTWRHPFLPWDATQLWIGDLDVEAGTVSNARCLAGVDNDDSIFQPGFLANDDLVFVSDRSNWWNLYHFDGTALAAGDTPEAEPLHPIDAEFGRPQWIFGMTTWAELRDGELIAAATRDGLWSLHHLDLARGVATPVPLEGISTIEEVHADGRGRAVVIAGGPRRAPQVISLDFGNAHVPDSLRDPSVPQAEEATRAQRTANAPTSESNPTPTVSPLSPTSELPLSDDAISVGEPISFASRDGRLAHAFHYPPASAEHRGPDDSAPPLLVKSHGGPTAATSNAFDPQIQYWTSRGFAVVDVNYGGSTGFGRAYRDVLLGRWGIVDIEDCVAAADHLVEQGAAHPRQRVIRGGSAGGYTTLGALTFTDAFQAGASHYGIGDLEALARDTHKFESRYLDRIVGPYPERRDLYRERSPIHHSDQIRCPVIFFQGTEDKIVPPNQAQTMADALAAQGLDHELVFFEGEGHGFRRAENIITALERELAFYRRVLGL